ncbi:MAG: hypothetical protein ThorAB25_02540 [Candidatus Thorarchaeota archaeon AB_25]|nr:MAG: hypothetical protein ThorAB25_02540 [Candidatus Thorarchaeota archaeon AB_25]
MVSLVLLLLQSPFDLQLPQDWFNTIGQILNVLFALAIRGYLIFVLVGMMVYATGLSDGLAKSLVILGVALYFGGPLIVNLFGQFSGVETITLESATSAWLQLVGMADAEIISILVWLGDAVAAICLLIGAILYFTPSANDMTGKGKSLMVRALMLAPILAFFHIAAWL